MCTNFGNFLNSKDSFIALIKSVGDTKEIRKNLRAYFKQLWSSWLPNLSTKIYDDSKQQNFVVVVPHYETNKIAIWEKQNFFLEHKRNFWGVKLSKQKFFLLFMIQWMVFKMKEYHLEVENVTKF